MNWHFASGEATYLLKTKWARIQVIGNLQKKQISIRVIICDLLVQELMKLEETEV